ncbi:hypothetical protein M758_10G000100 [Ceratodon purpureus]|nr:hypothetical protein M758_10G000100 [Ceratodon purpureus]
MATSVPILQTSAPILCRGGKERFIAGDLGFERLRTSCFRRGFTSTVGLPHHVFCSTSSRAWDSSTRRNSRFPNRIKNEEGSSAAKPVTVLPGDMKLLRDLQEFISSADLPPHQVPSTRELARRGRQDLANAVRRRGEKALSQLLSNPNFLSNNGTPKQSKPKSVLATASKSVVSDTSNGIFNPEVVSSSSSQPQGSEVFPQTTDLVPQSRTGLLIPHYEAAVERRPQNRPYQNDSSTSDDPIKVTDPDSSSISHGEGKNTRVVPRKPEWTRFSEVTAAYEGDSDNEEDIELYTYEDSSDVEDDKRARLKRFESLQKTEESKSWLKAAMLRSKLNAFFDKPVEKNMARPRRNLEAVFDIIAKQRESERFLQVGEQHNDMLSAVGADPAAEIARLSALLHTKEMKNLRLSRELEETKAMLALVRAKHSAELAQSKQLAVEQDLRLHAAEQALNSLKLRQVDWWGEGNRVELAGSFNGWQHHVYLLPDLSSRASQLPGTRGPLLWRVELWLYPGVYEIKFIVDGKWVLDNRLDIVQGHMGENNLLYVEP